MMLKFYLLFTALPPDTTILAVVKSGFPESDVYYFTKAVFAAEGASTDFIYGLPSAKGASSKEEERKVKKFKG